MGQNQSGTSMPYGYSVLHRFRPTSQASAPPPWGTSDGSQPRLSLAYRLCETAHCRKRAVQAVTLDCDCVPARAGNSIAAKIASVAMTTSSSITVKAVGHDVGSAGLDASSPRRPQIRSLAICVFIFDFSRFGHQ